MKLKLSLLIIDEKKGRRLAQELGIKITGLMGIILKAKEKNLLQPSKDLIEKLEQNDFRISSKSKADLLKFMNEL